MNGSLSRAPSKHMRSVCCCRAPLGSGGVFVAIQVQRQPPLSLPREALCARGSVLGLGGRGQQQAYQDGNDSDDDQQLDEREGGAAARYQLASGQPALNSLPPAPPVKLAHKPRARPLRLGKHSDWGCRPASEWHGSSRTLGGFDRSYRLACETGRTISRWPMRISVPSWMPSVSVKPLGAKTRMVEPCWNQPSSSPLR
jgi:hypothetical protein